MPLKAKLLAFVTAPSRRSIALIYVLFGVLWISVNAGLSSVLFANSTLAAYIGNLVDLMFIVLSGCILYFFIGRAATTPTTPIQRLRLRSRTPYLAAIFLSLLLVVPLINYGVIYLYKPKIEEDTQKNLGVVARIKVVQFVRWRESRIADGQVLAADNSFAELVDALQKKNSAIARQRISEHLDSIIAAYNFEGAELVNTNGETLIQRGTEATLDNVQQTLIARSLSSGKVSVSDLYLVGNDRIQLDVLAPISIRQGSQSRIIAFAIIHTGVDRFILPRVLSWPSFSSSAEVVITQAQGGYKKIISLKKGNKKQVALTQLALADSGIYGANRPLNMGKDYHGKLVFSIHEPITDSSWEINAQVDQAEVIAPLRIFLLWISVVALIAVLLVSGAVLMLLRQQKRVYQLELQAESGERDRLLKRFYETPFIGMAVSDPTSKCWREPNQRFCEIFGYSEEELLKTTWDEMTHPADLVRDLDYYHKFMQGEIEYAKWEKRFLHKDGSLIITHIEVNCLYSANGEIDAFLVAIEDITERKQAEAALQDSERRLSLVFRGTNDGWWDLDLVTNIAYHSPRWWTMLGYEPDQDTIDPTLWQRLTHPDDIEPTLKLICEVLASDQNSYEVELRMLHQDGHYVPMLTRAFVLRDEQGRPLRVSGANTDLSERKAAEVALRQSELLYREMFDTNPHPMWVFEINTLAFLAVNDAAISHYGWSRAEFLSMTIADIRPKEEASRLKQYLPQVIEKNINNSGEWQHHKKDGSLIDVVITSHALNFSGYAARLVLAYDVTERKRIEFEVRLLNRLLTMLTNVNQTIIRRLDLLELFDETCTIAVRDGGFRMAWIGLVDDESGMLRDVSYAGVAGDYVEKLRVDMNDMSKNGPSPRCIRTGAHVVCQDIASDESIAPWRETALANGYRSMIALPLRRFGKVVGNFSLYSEQKDIFNGRELDLLDELANDISFALEVVETEKERQAVQQALQESEAIFHTLASAAPVGILHTDIIGKPLYANERCFEMSGLTKLQMEPEHWAHATHPQDRKRVKNEWAEAVRAQRGFSMEYRFLRPDGSIVWVQGQAEPERDHAGNLLGFVGTITDITAIKRGEENLRLSAAVFDNTREGIMVTNAENRIVMVNHAFSEITRYEAAHAIGNEPKMLSSGRHDRDFYSLMWQSLKELDHWQGEIWNRRENGDIHPILMSISVIKDDAGAVVNYVGVFADISNIKASEAQLEFLAHHDPLTRLPNRLMLISRLGHAIEVARRDKSQLALLMLDLDRFKNVNDNFGHLAGDELLQMVAKRLSERLRGVDTVTRLGGDEFTVLLEDIAQPEDAARVAESIIAALELPWKLSNNIEVRIGASVGISLYPEHGTSALELLQHADAALYQAKAAGRGCACYFSESLTQAARYRFNIEARLRMAIPNEELRVYYQPKIDISSGKIIGVEALVRWQDPIDGLILPLRFIAIAEETGLIGPIGEWVMREACLQARRWLDMGLAPLSLAVNMSAHQLLHSDIVKDLSDVLTDTGFPPEYLELELTESILMQREDEIVETLNELRAKGIRLAIDDFGTGYSSLAYLKSFPLDVLKIDRSFVTDIESDPDDRAITTTIIGIAHTLGMQVVAEGVETEQQLEFLRAHECDMYQGFLVSPPLPAEELVRFIKIHKPG